MEQVQRQKVSDRTEKAKDAERDHVEVKIAAQRIIGRQLVNPAMICTPAAEKEYGKAYTASTLYNNLKPEACPYRSL